jgi:cytochrome c oxidase subunit 1
VENWIGEAPLVQHPYGYGVDENTLSLEAATGRDLWTGAGRR